MDILIKKAIKEIAVKEHIGHDYYYTITTRQIFDFMYDNNMGRRWISKIRIRVIRGQLPPTYREKKQ